MTRIRPPDIGLSVCLTVLMAFALPNVVHSQSCGQPVARVVSVRGTVEAQLAGRVQWQPVKPNDTYCPGDRIRAQARSWADLSLRNHSVLRLNANTTIVLEVIPEKRISLVGLLKSAAHYFSRIPGQPQKQNPLARMYR